MVSKFGRSLVEVWSKFGRSLVSQFGIHLFIKFTRYFIDIPSKLRPNFDTGCVEVWSKFGRSLVEVWSKFGRNFDTGGVEVWSKFRPNFDPPVSKFGLIDDDRNNQTITYSVLFKFIYLYNIAYEIYLFI